VLSAETYFDTGLVPTGVTLNGTSPVPLIANQMRLDLFTVGGRIEVASKDLQKGYWWSPSNYTSKWNPGA